MKTIFNRKQRKIDKLKYQLKQQTINENKLIDEIGHHDCEIDYYQTQLNIKESEISKLKYEKGRLKIEFLSINEENEKNKKQLALKASQSNISRNESNRLGFELKEANGRISSLSGRLEMEQNKNKKLRITKLKFGQIIMVRETEINNLKSKSKWI